MELSSRTCKDCGADLAGKRAHAEYCDSSCRASATRGRQATSDNREKALKSAAVHVLDDARGQQEEGKTSAEWALVAREHVMRTLLETGYFTADDLDPLGLPEHYRRSVHGLVTAYFRGPKPYMDEAGRRKSERPERKGAKNTVFRITAKGRRELPGLLNDLAATAGVDAGTREGNSGASAEALDRPHVPLSSGARKADVDPGGGETLSLLPEPPKLLDHDTPRAA